MASSLPQIYHVSTLSQLYHYMSYMASILSQLYYVLHGFNLISTLPCAIWLQPCLTFTTTYATWLQPCLNPSSTCAIVFYSHHKFITTWATWLQPCLNFTSTCGQFNLWSWLLLSLLGLVMNTAMMENGSHHSQYQNPVNTNHYIFKASTDTLND